MKVDRSCRRRRSRLNIDAVTNHRPGLNARRDETPVRTYRHAMLPSATDVSRTFVYPDTCSPKNITADIYPWTRFYEDASECATVARICLLSVAC